MRIPKALFYRAKYTEDSMVVNLRTKQNTTSIIDEFIDRKLETLIIEGGYIFYTEKYCDIDFIIKRLSYSDDYQRSKLTYTKLKQFNKPKYTKLKEIDAFDNFLKDEIDKYIEANSFKDNIKTEILFSKPYQFIAQRDEDRSGFDGYRWEGDSVSLPSKQYGHAPVAFRIIGVLFTRKVYNLDDVQ